jgi:lipid kinase YegS
MHVWLVIHSASEAAIGALRAGARRLRAAGHVVVGRLSFEEGDPARFAAEAAERGADLVVACGGDGTVNEVVNGLCGWAASRGRGEHGGIPRLAIVPLGTANDLAAGLGIPAEIPDALAVAAGGRARVVDLGVVNGRRFLNVSVGGFGTDATDGATGEVKRVLGPLAYVLRGVQELVEMDAVDGRFHAGGECLFAGAFLFFAVGNGRRTGGGNLLTPRADASDGLLDVCIVPALSRAQFVALAPLLRSGRHVDRDEVIYRQVSALEVEADAPLRVNADGEPMEGTRFSYGVEPARLTLMLPVGAEESEG